MKSRLVERPADRKIPVAELARVRKREVSRPLPIPLRTPIAASSPFPARWPFLVTVLLGAVAGFACAQNAGQRAVDQTPLRSCTQCQYDGFGLQRTFLARISLNDFHLKWPVPRKTTANSGRTREKNRYSILPELMIGGYISTKIIGMSVVLKLKMPDQTAFVYPQAVFISSKGVSYMTVYSKVSK